MISGNWAADSNGVLTIATKVEEDLTACDRRRTTCPFGGGSVAVWKRRRDEWARSGRSVIEISLPHLNV